MYRNVVFDLGGVLLQWDLDDILSKLQAPSNFTEVLDSLLWAAHDGGLISRWELIEKLPEKYNKEKFFCFIQSIAPNLNPIPEMVELFQQVRSAGYKVYLLSNWPKEMHEEIADRYDFLSHFEGSLYSYEAKAIKPQLQIYQMLCDRYRLQPRESIFIDDRADNITAAKVFGMEGILFQNPRQVREELSLRKIQLLDKALPLTEADVKTTV